MTIQELREELSAALRIQQQIDRQMESLRDIQESGGIRGMASGGGGTSTITAPELSVEIQATIQQLQEDLRIEKEIIRRKIISYNLCVQEECILSLRYVRCLQWTQVAKLIGYTKRHTLRLVDYILEKLSPDVT